MIVDEGLKRKRDSREDVATNERARPSIASSDASGAHSPLPSPKLSVMAQAPVAANGNGSRRAPDKTMRRNIDRVLYGNYDIKTWYYSPYPFDEEEWAAMTETSGSTSVPRRSKADSRLLSPSTTSSTRESSLSRPGGALSTSADKAPALQALEIEPSLSTRRDDSLSPPAKTLWVCDGCFKYMRSYGGYTVHKRDCKQTHPPGRKVYQRGAHIIWEVDGAKQKLYAQNLCLFGKLFIDHKTIYFDVEPFMFYVLTDASSQFDHVLGFFSKEKMSYDDYNLACIITFPPFQKKGYGTLMIEFKRPLSDLGFKGYLSYWCAVVLRTLALFFDEQTTSILNCLLPASHTFVTSGRGRHSSAHSATGGSSAMAEARQKKEMLRVRRILGGDAILDAARHIAKVNDSPQDGSKVPNQGRTPKGWAGEMPASRLSRSLSQDPDSSYESSTQVIPNLHVDSKGSSRDVLLEMPEPLVVETTLDRLSLATNLRLEDLCYALAELGLFELAKGQEHGGTFEFEQNDGAKTFAISQETVRRAFEANRIKRPILDVDYILHMDA